MVRDEFNLSSGISKFESDPLPTVSEIELDVSGYISELDGLDMSEPQMRALIETLWPIVRSFVELGFSPENCGQLFARFTAGDSEIRSGGKIIEGKVNRSSKLAGPTDGTVP